MIQLMSKNHSLFVFLIYASDSSYIDDKKDEFLIARQEKAN